MVTTRSGSQKPTSDDTPGAQHSAVYSSTLDYGADDPQNASHLECHLPGEPIGKERAAKRSDETAGGHRGGDGSLGVAKRLGIVEITGIGLGSEHTRHGRNIETEESSS